MAIQFGPIMMPCRTCDADPGEGCRANKSRPLTAGVFHMRRELDAKLASDLIDRPPGPIA